MKSAAVRWGALVLLACLVATRGVAQDAAPDAEAAASSAAASKSDVTDRDRTWASFSREAATVGDGHFWVELRGMKLNDDEGADKTDATAGVSVSGPALGLSGYPVNSFERRNNDFIEEIDGGRFDLIAAYGLGPYWELGMDLPFVMQQQISLSSGASQDDVGVGDLMFYGKFKKELAEHWAGALGLEMSIPTGSEDELFGSGELGLNPFLSTRYQAGRFALGAHVGFLLNTDDQADVFNWSVQGIVRGNELFSLRTEFVGRVFNDFGQTFNDIAAYPGIDFNLTDNVIIRPEGLAHLTDDAIDWGIGIGFVFTM
ncbi:MAG: hypothetical protein ACRERC_11145 [Candidatus Binatia bacterium]